jgi:hypothetical protein
MKSVSTSVKLQLTQEISLIPAEFPVQIEESNTRRHLGQGEVRRNGALGYEARNNGVQQSEPGVRPTWAFSCESAVCCKLNHPWVVPVYVFAAATAKVKQHEL